MLLFIIATASTIFVGVFLFVFCCFFFLHEKKPAHSGYLVFCMVIFLYAHKVAEGQSIFFFFGNNYSQMFSVVVAWAARKGDPEARR